jgi:type I restriction enzyme, S subunit
MAKTLPNGWIKTSLAEICLPVATIQPSDSPEVEYTYFDIGGIDNRTNTIAETKTVTGRSAPSRARQAIQQNDILFSTVRTYLRNVAIVEQDYPNPVASTGFAVIRPAEGICALFLFFQVLSDEFIGPLNALQSGSSYPAVRAKEVFSRPVLLPPSREQERIAEKLTGAFSALRRAETVTVRALNKVGRYRASVLDAAATGALTRDWRKVRRMKSDSPPESATALLKSLLTARRTLWESSELRRLRKRGKAQLGHKWKSRYREPISPNIDDLQNLPKGWTWATIDQLSWASGYGTSVKCTSEGKGPPVLRIPNIRSRSIDVSELKFATISRRSANIQYVAPGDLLVIRTNGSKDLIGRAAVFETQLKRNLGFASYLIRFRLVGDETLWSWLALAWDSGFIRTSIEAKAVSTAGQYNVSLSRLNGIAIPLPPPIEQRIILREVERRLLAADRLKKTLDHQHARSLATRQHLLHQAFTGQLVPHDPKDEPVPLKNIRATQESLREKQIGKRMANSKLRQRAKRGVLVEVLQAQTRPVTPEQLFREANFKPSDVDLFYRELKSLRSLLREQTLPNGKLWPRRPYILLQLKEGGKK